MALVNGMINVESNHEVKRMSNQFLTNYTELSFIDKLKDNLRRCCSFSFSVSFIKSAGLNLIINDIEAALERGAKGKVITSTYQNFTDIESLKVLLRLQSEYKNFQCHLDFESFHDNAYRTLGYHSKGYLFEFEDHYEVIVGSSNITLFALKKNIEWDVVVYEKIADIYNQAIIEFDDKWNGTKPLDREIINKYSQKLNYAVDRWDMDYELAVARIKPNYMQKKALKELNRYRVMGVNRALVVAAMGSGKTYLSAFDACNFNPKRLLYIVHEETILNKSLATFMEVFGNNVTYGIFTGKHKDMDADFLFSTNITMCNYLSLFSRTEFDYIIIDECHHATASTYRKIIEYFKPEFLLGLTATPERMDEEDVFGLFDKNVPYELRLRDAIIYGLVVPFKYYGIRDSLINYGLKPNEERKMIAQLANVEHIAYISSKIEEYRGEGKLKALAFCRNITHARMMAEAMSDYYKTAYLTGKNSAGERLCAINDLQRDDGGIEILFTVDILNEGVDIPAVNMVLFLRPTESSTIFLQQLGRGLRKYDNKDYVTVLDFIGNDYARSTQIAFALGNLSKNLVLEKRLMQQMVRDDFQPLGLLQYGVEIHMDEESKDEIIKYIEKENFNKLDFLKKDYFNYKSYLHVNSDTFVRHIDYLNDECAPNIIRFMSVKTKGKKARSYYNFLRQIGEKNLPEFSDRQISYINYVSEFLPCVRKHEYLIFDCLQKNICDINVIKERLFKSINDCRNEEIEHALKFILKSKFISMGKDSILKLNVERDADFDEYMDDLLQYGIERFDIEFGEETDFKLWYSYRKDQVQLLFLKNMEDIMKGTYYYSRSVVIFASINKNLSEEDRLNYKDRFISSSVFQWESMADISDNDLKKIDESENAYLFIRKDFDDKGLSLPFTFVGKGILTNKRKQEGYDKAKGKRKITYLFDVVMENELPEYLQYDFGLLK